MDKCKINDIDYEYEFKLKNSDDQEVKFTKSAIRGLSIVDNVFVPFLNATITIANPYDLLEDKYFLRGDGRDEFTIKFNPVDNPDDKIDEVFIIDDEGNDGNPLVRSENLKTFSLIDKKSLPFTDKIPYGKAFSGKVGKILKDIFKDILGDDKVDENEWEDGDFEIAYMPPLYHRYIDVIFYLMQHYYAKDGDLYVKGFINWDSDKEKYQLKLLSKIFEKNKENIMEAFILGDLTDKTNTSNVNNPPPDGEVAEYIGPLRNAAYSTPMYGWNNGFIQNTIVHGYDPIMGIHKMRKIKLDDVQKKWEKKFVDSFKSMGGKPKPFVIKNKTTKEKFRHFRTSYPVEDAVKIVEAEMHNILTFYNLQCTFSNMGASNRKSGKFIDIVKTSDTSFKSDQKLVGRWYVTEIRHNFMGDQYMNEILSCKTYVGPETKTKDDSE